MLGWQGYAWERSRSNVKLAEVPGVLVKKKVSWASLAGCCCGWNSASKFQKLQHRNQRQTYAVSQGKGEVTTQ